MRVIALTGGVGAGKSLVLSILENEYKAEVIKADEVAHELMKPGREGYVKIVETLGDHILKADGTIDRKILSQCIFRDDRIRKAVNEIIHPLVWKNIKGKISSSQAGLIVVEFAIMGEKAEVGYDEMWYIYASEPVRIRRLFENRGYEREHSERIIASQAKEADYLARCDRVIRNDGSIEEIRDQLAEILNNRGQNET
ncbi:dephospho-CoA kinase [Lacrimispora sp. JR3]|uniref:dephospho-CoA kinase n=1 Tax=Lacrimispora sinapis TaxID=3111456 RepID=UPI003749129A